MKERNIEKEKKGKREREIKTERVEWGGLG